MKELIQRLRVETGAGMLDCKKALVQCGNDFDKAKDFLIQKFGEKALNKVDRETNEGIVVSYIHSNRKMGSMVVLKCETDFVAKNEVFVQLANDIAMHVAAINPSDIKELLGQGFVKDGSVTIDEMVKRTIGKIGENIVITDFKCFTV